MVRLDSTLEDGGYVLFGSDVVMCTGPKSRCNGLAVPVKRLRATVGRLSSVARVSLEVEIRRRHGGVAVYRVCWC